MSTRREGGDPTGSFVLDVPPEPEQVRTARLFAASLARHYGADEDLVEDLKVAISEAATNSIAAHRNGGIDDPIRIAADFEEGGLRFRVVDAGPGLAGGAGSGDGIDLASTLSGMEGNLGLMLIRSLFPDVKISRNAGRGSTLSFLLETQAPSAGRG